MFTCSQQLKKPGFTQSVKGCSKQVQILRLQGTPGDTTRTQSLARPLPIPLPILPAPLVGSSSPC